MLVVDVEVVEVEVILDMVVEPFVGAGGEMESDNDKIEVCVMLGIDKEGSELIETDRDELEFWLVIGNDIGGSGLIDDEFWGPVDVDVVEELSTPSPVSVDTGKVMTAPLL